MERQVTCMRETIAMEKRVGVALFKLCSTAEDRTVATLFGIGRSTVNELYREFCETVVAVLEPEWVKLMTPKELPEHIREFQAALEFPQGVGALDGCQFAVSRPQENASDYHNYKGWYSIILLALVDHRYRFRYVNVGAPGRCHDAHVFRRSELAKHFNDGVEPQWVTEVHLYDRMFLHPLCRTDVAAGNGQDVKAAIAAYLHRRSTQQHTT
ncbi:hypothetical protein HPB47_000581 [Ixodes persulcatus]|uniref:Uncharacterized protein n=1 Tax=Ixodes persulcatus TaxID=34615 RepID=A0AC60PRE0_IXOPE|nr:hypothetical protein HPB47_000581 [Ixodes persulcatus]